MSNPILARAVKLAILSSGAAAASMGGSATLAATDGTIEEIVVTGSRIVRNDLDAVSPMAVVSNEEFLLSGSINIEQKIAELPQTLPSFGPSSNNPGDGTARVDLRGLGTSRTLVLVNGRRWVNSTQSGVVDLNTIPGTLIEQVDVVTGGASAVYGSDAVAGVVNFKLKDDFEGIQITGLADTTSESDAEKYNFDLTLGGNFDEGRGNAVIYLGYVEREALFQGDRSFTKFALTEDSEDTNGDGVDDRFFLSPGGSSGVPGTRVFGGPSIDPDGIPASGDEFTLGTFDSSGSALPWIEPSSRFNYAPDNFLQLPQTRTTMMAMAHYDLSDKVTAYTELTFVNNEVPQELAPTPAFVGTLEVNPDSPFFAPEVQTALAGTRTTDTNGDGLIDGNDNVFLPFIGRRMVENGSRQAVDERDAWRLLLGVRGDITDTWSYDAYYTHAKMNLVDFLNNDVSETRFRQAVLVTDDGSACQNTSGGCAPLNIFGPGNISDAAITFINVGASNSVKVEQDVYNATVTGTLFSIGDAQPIALAIGVEHRSDRSAFRPDEFLASGDVLGFNAGDTTKGNFDVNEIYAEIDVPLLQDAPGAKSLGLWAAGRISDYSTIGNVTTYAGALNWSPVDMVRVRGGFQRAVRAPNVNELFLGQSNGFPGATDPCSVDGAAGSNPSQALTDLCVATGVAPAQVGVFTQANSQIEGLFGGNPNLSEETSDTVTLGVVVQPIDGLDISLDYYNIEVEDAIDILGGSVDNVLDICFNQIQSISSNFCQAISRRADGNVDVVNVLNENIAKIETAGYDLTVNYVTELDFGFFDSGSVLAVTLRGTFLDKWDQTPVVGLGKVNHCAGNFGLTCDDPRPEYQFNTRVSWNTGPLGLSLLWRYMDSVDDDSIENDGVASNTLAVPEIDSIHYFDLTATYDFNDNLRVNVGVKNLFDETPTKVGDAQEQGNSFPETYDLIGTRYFVSASYEFN